MGRLSARSSEGAFLGGGGRLKNFFEVFDLRLFWGGSRSKYPLGGLLECLLERILEG